jgi:hypothetical protein
LSLSLGFCRTPKAAADQYELTKFCFHLEGGSLLDYRNIRQPMDWASSGHRQDSDYTTLHNLIGQVS